MDVSYAGHTGSNDQDDKTIKYKNKACRI